MDPIRRITTSDITQHPFFTIDLLGHLSPHTPVPGLVLGRLSTLVLPPKQFDFEIVGGLGTIEDDVVDADKRKLGKRLDTSLTLATVTQLPIPPCNALLPTLSPLPGEGEIPSKANMARPYALISTPCQHLPPFLCYPPVNELCLPLP
ncbi:hypothetical protein BDQ17DRAFT_1365532 [Cyathus striatus]|nr:hypothetical protein BDQ17DRAFT_1365532 [Cyathus striatus]